MHEVTGANTLNLKGDCTALAASGDYWLLTPPPGVNPQTGTLASIDGDGNTTWHAAQPRDTSTAAARPNAPGRFLWAHYRYLPPMVGFTDDEGATVGEMGGNKLGNYHCRNRVYDILQGRWTSPDPAASPWNSIFAYCGSLPVACVDPTGLSKRDGKDCEGLTVKVATIHKDGKQDDAIDETVAEYVGRDNASRSAIKTYGILEKAIKDSGKACACIEELQLHGHCGRGLGGGQIDDSTAPDGETYYEKIASLLCDDATIVNYHCFGGDVDFSQPGSENVKILGLLRKRGGAYVGWTGKTTYHEWFPGLGPVWTGGKKKSYKVGKGDTNEDLKKKYPAGGAKGADAKKDGPGGKKGAYD